MSQRNQIPEVVVAGHICLDIIPQFESCMNSLEKILIPGKLIDVGAPILATGGAVANTGLALNRLGITPQLVGKVGDDEFGKIILNLLSTYDERLPKDMIVSEKDISSYSVVLNPPNIDRIFFHCNGSNNSYRYFDIEYDKLKDAKLFHFGYPPLMKNIYSNNAEELIKIFSKVKNSGLITSMDMALPDPNSESGRLDWKKILDNVLPYVDIFLPSIEEILFMLERETYNKLKVKEENILDNLDLEMIKKIADQLLEMGVAIVVLKLGNHGIYVRTTEDAERIKKMVKNISLDINNWLGRELFSSCFEVEVAGTTGAGDCTIAGFLAGIIKGFNIEKSIQIAVGAGACCVEKFDATSGVLDIFEIEKRIKDGWKTRKVFYMENEDWVNKLGLWFGPNDSKYKNIAE